MLYINKLTADPQQQVILTGIPGQSITMNLRYMPRIQRWMMSLSVGTTNINGIMVTTSPNMLRQFANTLGFGIACLTSSGLDPYQLTDFLSQASNLYLLDSDDVAEIEAEYEP